MAIERTLCVTSFDVDSSGYARPSALMHWMQELAGEDLAQFGLTYPMMRQRGYVFVLFAMKLQIQSPMRAGDEYLLKSYSVGTHGATFTRDFYFISRGRTVATASTKWVLLDFKERKILHPSRLDAPLRHFPEMSTGMDVAKRLDTSLTEKTDRRRVYPSMLDENNHLNNCVYADLTTDYLPQAPDRFVSELEILFTHEAALCEELEIRKEDKENGLVVYAHNLSRDLPCFSARAVTSPVSKE